MIPEIGNFSLILALLLAITQGTLPIIGATRGIPSWIAGIYYGNRFGGIRY